MTQIDSETTLAGTLVGRDGKRRYDRQSKRRLVEACLQPGVSVAGLALKAGINANLLRRWITLHQQRSGMAVATQVVEPMCTHAVPSAFERDRFQRRTGMTCHDSCDRQSTVPRCSAITGVLFAYRLRRQLAKVEEHRGCHTQRIGQYTDVDERDVALTPFDLAQIGTGEATFECKSLLRPAVHLAKLDQAFSE